MGMKPRKVFKGHLAKIYAMYWSSCRVINTSLSWEAVGAEANLPCGGVVVVEEENIPSGSETTFKNMSSLGLSTIWSSY